LKEAVKTELWYLLKLELDATGYVCDSYLYKQLYIDIAHGKSDRTFAEAAEEAWTLLQEWGWEEWHLTDMERFEPGEPEAIIARLEANMDKSSKIRLDLDLSMYRRYRC
jgi:hypothetical protein